MGGNWNTKDYRWYDLNAKTVKYLHKVAIKAGIWNYTGLAVQKSTLHCSFRIITILSPRGTILTIGPRTV